MLLGQTEPVGADPETLQVRGRHLDGHGLQLVRKAGLYAADARRTRGGALRAAAIASGFEARFGRRPPIVTARAADGAGDLEM